MWPWGHLAVGYLLYTGYCRYRYDLRPQGVQALAVAFGTQLPDLVDKPLAWYVGILPNGRSLGHSLIVAGVVLMALWIYAERTDRQGLAGAFGLGYLSHLFADGLYPALGGEWYFLGYLGWPVVAPIEYETGKSLFAHLLALELTAFFLFEVGLFVTAVVVWYVDGKPGLRTVLTLVLPHGNPETSLDDGE